MTLARISLFHKLLIKVAIHLLVYNTLYTFFSLLYIGPTFQTIGKRPRFLRFIYTYCDSARNKILFFKKYVGISPKEAFFNV